jgi:uncharacterized membrane protein
MKTKKIVFMGMLIACSFVGAYVDIFSTIAFDSMPGFFGALMLGPIYGGIIAAVGHFITALLRGFPQTFPVHLIIMFTMFIAAYGLGKVQELISRKYNRVLGIIIGGVLAIIINGPVALLMCSPLTGMAIFAYTPVLCIAAAANVILAEVVYLAIPVAVKENYKESFK